MFGQHWDELHQEQFLLGNIQPPPLLPIPKSYEHDSFAGDLKYSSSDCSSSSPNSIGTITTYGGAHSPTAISYSRELVYTIAADHFQGVQHNEECPNSIIESMNRATPYTPHEKKERIERYRSKRNLRNFNKKIKYECRKTLADSRPRVRGRFAKNDDTDKAAAPPSEWDHQYIEQCHDISDDYNWIGILDAFSTNLMS